MIYVFFSLGKAANGYLEVTKPKGVLVVHRRNQVVSSHRHVIKDTLNAFFRLPIYCRL